MKQSFSAVIYKQGINPCVDVGYKIKIELEVDPQLRTIPMPRAFEEALEHNQNARREFEKLTPSRWKDILLYMTALKRPESLQKVIDRVMKSLTKAE